MTDSMDELLSPKEAVAILRCSVETLHSERKKGKIGFTMVAGRIHFMRRHVSQYLKDQTQEAKPCLDQTKAPAYEPTPGTESTTYSSLERERQSNVQRILGKCRRLKKGSQSSYSNSAASGNRGHVIPLTSR